MRFFYQDEVGEVSTKCIRVSSTATTLDVLQILIEKFRPDLRMLNTRSQFYSLYEVHSSKGMSHSLMVIGCIHLWLLALSRISYL